MSRIWVPKTKILEARRAVPFASNLAGRFKMEAVRPDGRVRLLADWFPNLITNAGLNIIGTAATWLNACRVGTGSTTPNVADTGMDALVAGTTTLQSNVTSAASTPPYVGRGVRTYRFGAGVAAGNLAEVGIATQAAVGGTQFSRALILDGDGNPTTITVLSDEFLDVTYELQVIVPPSDVVSTITIGGIEYDTTTRAANATNAGDWAPGTGVIGGCVSGQAYSGTIGAITALPSGTNASFSSEAAAAYGNNNLYAEKTFTWTLSAANFGASGVRAISFNTTLELGAVQIAFANGDSPAKGIPKTSSTVMALVCRHTWGRGTPV